MIRLSQRTKSPFFAAAILFAFCSLLQVHGQNPTGRQVAVTFDDLPATGNANDLGKLKEINSKLLSVLRELKVPAIGFVNESKLFRKGEIDERTQLLRDWLENGHQLGNHTFSHIAINNAGFEEYKEDLIRGETVTRMLLAERSLDLKYFRHTQLRTGPDEEYKKKLSEFLKDRGYTVAPVTIDNNEYIFAAVYAAALANDDTDLAERTAAEYVKYMDSVFEHFETLSRDFLGREIPQILLLHANEINADRFGELAAMMKRRNYSFVTIDAALEDEAYRLPEAQSRRGLSWIHRWMLAKGLEMREEPPVADWISNEFRLLSR